MSRLLPASRPARILRLAAGILLAYHLLLALVVLARFGAWPNYFQVHPLLENLGLVLGGTPSWLDAIRIALQEPWLEFGYANPDYYGIAEWSYMILPSRLLLVALASLLLAWSLGRARACPARAYSPAALNLAGASLVGLGCASLTWVVCCAYPSWIVLLAILGLDSALALKLEPWGLGLVLAGIGLQLAVLYWQHKRAQRGRDVRGEPTFSTR